MAGVSPRIRIEAGELESLLTSMAGSLDLRKGGLGRRIADVMRADALRQFQAGGVPGWAPLSPRTIEAKRRMGYPRLNRRGIAPRALIQRGNFGPENVLMRTGALLTSWTRLDDPHHVEEVTKDSVSTGSDLVYAGTHQHGGQGWQGAPIPARPIVVTDQAMAKIAEIVEDHALNEGT